MTLAITVTPNPVPSGGADVTVAGTGAELRKSSILLEGVEVAAFLVTDGTFSKTFPVSASPTTQHIVFQQCVAGTYLQRATKTVTIEDTPPAEAALTDLTGWRLVFDDGFDREMALGDLLVGGLSTGMGTVTADKRYLVRKRAWTDTSGHGTRGDDAIVEITGGRMVMHPYTDSTGFGHNCILGPLGSGATSIGDLPGGRFLIDFRGDVLLGHKAVPLWWPGAQSGSDPPNKLGEMDMAEASWDKPPKWYVHSADGTNTGHQAFGSYTGGTSLQDRHQFVSEWKPGVSVENFLDGASMGIVHEGDVVSGSAIHIPTATMHPVMQFETSTDGEARVPSTTGLIEIYRVGLWVPA